MTTEIERAVAAAATCSSATGPARLGGLAPAPPNGKWLAAAVSSSAPIGSRCSKLLLASPTCEQRRFVINFSICLFRACLGKMISRLVQNGSKEGVFRAHLRAVHRRCDSALPHSQVQADNPRSRRAVRARRDLEVDTAFLIGPHRQVSACRRSERVDAALSLERRPHRRERLKGEAAPVTCEKRISVSSVFLRMFVRSLS